MHSFFFSQGEVMTSGKGGEVFIFLMEGDIFLFKKKNNNYTINITRQI